MTDLLNLIQGADLNETICKIVALFAAIEFAGSLFGFIGGFSRR